MTRFGNNKDCTQIASENSNNINPTQCKSATESLLLHDGKRASIIMDDFDAIMPPWSPKALGRAKSAIIYKNSLNDNLMTMQKNLFFFSEWTSYFVSLQKHSLILYSSREKWEQGLIPDKVIKLSNRMLLSDMRVEATETGATKTSCRLFSRKILEIDGLDEWLNTELQQGLVVSDGSVAEALYTNNAKASAHCVLEFASHNQNTFELWTKSIRRVLMAKRKIEQLSNNEAQFDQDNNAFSEDESWISPGRDSRLTLHQSEVWCQRVLMDERGKAESELRRIIAMEKLISQVTNSQMALLVYEKVSRVHELFVANSRREIEGLDQRSCCLSANVLNFFADHLKRKYSVFLILTLAYGIREEEIRQAHEKMCSENASVCAGIGGGEGEMPRTATSYGFDDEDSLELYEKYRDAAENYHKMNFGDGEAAEEEDAIMHLPVMLQVAMVRNEKEEVTVMSAILENVKQRLHDYCSVQENEQA